MIRKYGVQDFAFCCVALFLSTPRFPEDLPNAHRVATTSVPQANKPGGTHFVNKGSGEIKAGDGNLLAFTIYEAFDGTKLTVLHREFDSSALAKEHFNSELRNAMKIVHRSMTQSNTAKPTRERAELTILQAGGGKPLSAVLWTQGADFREIISESRQDLLELEKQYFDNGRG